jgi:Tfp pilus assembly protein PilN
MSNNATFLPEDYLAKKAERRTNIISLVLFAVVMGGVFLAFLVTNQKWTQVKQRQEDINGRYQKAALQIKELNQLETQKEEMLHKAELAAALVERVPRSILLAELINRMPERLSLLAFELESEKLKPVIVRKDEDGDGAQRIGPRRAKTKEEALDENQKIRPPRYRVEISLTGVAPTDLEVSRYLAELNAYELLRNVTLDYSEEKDVEGQVMREFNITMELAMEADVRSTDPHIPPRNIDNPMTDEIRIAPPGANGTSVMVDPQDG